MSKCKTDAAFCSLFPIPCSLPHSYRSASIGSKFDAFQAG
jgi:hypothetical protein